MKIDVYQITNHTFLSVRIGTDPRTIELEKLDLSSLKLFKSDIDLDSPYSIIGLNKSEVKDQIENNGYAIHGVRIDFTIIEGRGSL